MILVLCKFFEDILQKMKQNFCEFPMSYIKHKKETAALRKIYFLIQLPPNLSFFFKHHPRHLHPPQDLQHLNFSLYPLYPHLQLLFVLNNKGQRKHSKLFHAYKYIVLKYLLCLFSISIARYTICSLTCSSS